jgi:uncharacterized protein (DUF1919 family)
MRVRFAEAVEQMQYYLDTGKVDFEFFGEGADYSRPSRPDAILSDIQCGMSHRNRQTAKMELSPAVC